MKGISKNTEAKPYGCKIFLRLSIGMATATSPTPKVRNAPIATCFLRKKAPRAKSHFSLFEMVRQKNRQSPLLRSDPVPGLEQIFI